MCVLYRSCRSLLFALSILSVLPRRYGFSNMRYIASLISGVGIFMMGAGLSWYHGIMGLLHPQPMESLLWVSVSGKPGGPEVLSNGADPLVLSYRPTVFWQVPWSQREVSLTNISFIIRIFHLFELKRSRSCFAATLLVAINEIKKSARQNGLSFYEYGLCAKNPFDRAAGFFRHKLTICHNQLEGDIL